MSVSAGSYPSPIAIMPVIGEIDLSNADDLLARIKSMLRTHGAVERLVLDLAGVTFMDCSGIRGILKAQDYALSKGCELTVRQARPGVFDLISILGLHERLGLGVTASKPAERATAAFRQA